jgi:hypothetical protein
MIEKIINLRMLSEPINWFIVWAIVMIWGFALMTARDGLSASCGCDQGIPD